MTYATLLAAGWDTVEETFRWRIRKVHADSLDYAKKEAEEADPQGAAVVKTAFGSEMVIMRSTGAKGGFRWVCANDDLLFMIQPAKGGVAKVRYLAAGLWEHGLDALRERAERALRAFGEPIAADWRKVVRADWAFDYWSPEFTADMRFGIGANVVCHSSCKTRIDGSAFEEIGRAGRVETLTIGAKGGLQVQVYDKGLEITEASGKTWMIDLWGREGYHPPDEGRPRDVWRLEIRMFKEFLRNRRINTVEELHRELRSLLSEAIFARRLTTPNPSDSNRRRWSLHPLWQLAQDAAGGDAMLPIGRKVTGARQVVVARLIKQAAGTARAAVVARTDGFTSGDAEAALAEALAVLKGDIRGRSKVLRLRDRYELLDEAQ